MPGQARRAAEAAAAAASLDDAVAAAGAGAPGRGAGSTDPLIGDLRRAGLLPLLVLHFAAHAVLNEHQPELSGIALSLYDSRGRATDGFVRLNDVMQLRLHSQLVVLSACERIWSRFPKFQSIV